jgi:hypothetical protein
MPSRLGDTNPTCPAQLPIIIAHLCPEQDAQFVENQVRLALDFRADQQTFQKKLN